MQSVSTLPRRLDVIQAHKAQGGSVAAVFPIHYPRALFRAFDILPVEVWGPPGASTSQGKAHLQPYVCSVVRNGLAFLQTGGLDVADFLIVPHTCDSFQGLGSVLIDFVDPGQPVLPIYLPRATRGSDIDFLAAELRAIYLRLETITGLSPSEADLLASIAREEAADDLLHQLHRSREQLSFSTEDFYRLIRAREYLPAEIFTEIAQEALSQTYSTARSGIPIIISGIVPEPMSVFSALDEMGGWVAADDLACCGRRLYPRGKSGEPFQRMAERLLHAPPDPTRGNAISDRVRHLLKMAERTRAKGVLFYTIKFCEPELFDLPILRGQLQDAGIPSLVIEVEIDDPLSMQTLTRLSAFLEMLA